MFGLRSRLAELLLHVADRIAPSVDADDQSMVLKAEEEAQDSQHNANPDLCADADAAQRPNAQTQALTERVKQQSLRAMQIEAVDAIAAFYGAHAAGAAIWQDRSVGIWTDVRMGKPGVEIDTAQEITSISTGWMADAVRIQTAAQLIADIHVADEPLEQALKPLGVEREMVAEVVDAVAVAHAREKLQEQEQEDEDNQQREA